LEARARPALAVFVDHAECRWLRTLKPGYRHCFVAVRDGGSWLVCDPVKDRMELVLLTLPARFDLAQFYAGRGHRVLVGRTRPDLPRRPLLPTPLTCVAVVKRIVGVRAPWVLTPWQLFRHLSRGPAGWQTAAHELLDMPTR
jgi:hypothetical protein